MELCNKLQRTQVTGKVKKVFGQMVKKGSNLL